MLESKQGTIREALCDNFDTPKAVNELFFTKIFQKVVLPENKAINSFL